jgi:CSLREA domain-containing protein
MTCKLIWKIVFATATIFGFSDAWAIVAIQVNSIADEIDDDVTDGVCHTASGTCTLRAALMTANRETFDTQINVPAGIYALSIPAAPGIDEGSGDLDLTSPTASTNVQISIVGAGIDATVIDGAGHSRVFNIGDQRDALFQELTIRGGSASPNEGGGIFNEGYLTLFRVKVSGNSSDGGGGVFNGGSLSLLFATIADNIANIEGGGIFNAGTLSVNHSMIIGNVSHDVAGGVENFLGFLLCLDSTFDSNSGQIGGALQTSAAVQIINCTFSNNSAVDGGAIQGEGPLTIVNSTVANNHATDSGGGFFRNQDDNNAWNVYNATIAYNDADSDADRNGSGGGIFVLKGSGTTGALNIYNTLVAGNTVGQSPQADDCDGNGVLYTHANNLFGSTAKCPIVQVSGAYGQLNSLSYLGPLADNGGDTSTVALLRGSSAIDAGYSGGCFDNSSSLITVDQRGFLRPVGAACDVGAYEYNDDIFKNGFE